MGDNNEFPFYRVTANGKPVISNGKPVISTGKPVISNGKPVISNGKPVISNGKPVIANGKPVIANGKLVISKGKPVISKGKPVVSKGKPVVSKGKLVISKGKPVVSKGKLGIAKGKHEPMHVVDIEDEDMEPEMINSATHQPTSYSGDGNTVMTFHDIVYTVRDTCCQGIPKEIIKGISGIFEPGLNAIMGATGSGKTSLLDIIASRKDPRGLEGNILVNGEKQPDNFRHMTGYVAQDDVVMGTLTVRENIRFSANLRLPSNITNAEKDKRVTDIINELGLPHVAQSKVGTEFVRGISGGERKRTNIGMELIIDPKVLFLDEPTTGLDASTANAVMLLLSQLGLKGRTIIFSIHQPRYSIFRLFNNLVLLSRGHMVYHGPSQEVLHYFSTIGYECELHNNPADFFLDIINGDSTAVQPSSVTNAVDDFKLHDKIAAIEADYKSDDKLATELGNKYRASRWWTDMTDKLRLLSSSSRGGISSDTLPCGRYATSFFTQFRYVSKRTVLNIVRTPQTGIMQVMIMVLIGLLMGAIYFQMKLDKDGLTNRVGVFFYIITAMVYGNLSSVELFIKDRKIFIHEQSIGFYRVSVYFLAKVLCDVIPSKVIPNILFSVIVYFMTGLVEDVDKFCIFFLVVNVTSLAASFFAFFLSASVSDIKLAHQCVTLCYLFMTVFAGVLIQLNTLLDWLAWLKWVSIFRYGINGLLVNELKGLKFCVKNATTGAINPITCITGEHRMKEMGVPYGTDWDLWLNVVALLSMVVGLPILTYIQLRRVNKYS